MTDTGITPGQAVRNAGTAYSRLGKDMHRSTEVTNGLLSTRREVDRQDRKWGDQDHPATHPGFEATDRANYAREARMTQRANDERQEAGNLAWDLILLEEVYEAFAEEDPDKYEAELIQVAAVAINAWTASRRARMRPLQDAINRALLNQAMVWKVPLDVLGMTEAEAAKVFKDFPPRAVTTQETSQIEFSLRGLDETAHRLYLNDFAAKRDLPITKGSLAETVAAWPDR